MPSPGRSHALASDLGLLLIRLMLAAVFVFHGSQKLFGWFDGHGIRGTAGFFDSLGIPMATTSAVVAGAAEFFGGLVLLLGTGTRLAAVPLIVTMLVATFTAHYGFDAARGGMEYALTLAVVLTGLLLMGPGRFTLLRLIRKDRTSPRPNRASR